jgi:hypothetical protein
MCRTPSGSPGARRFDVRGLFLPIAFSVLASGCGSGNGTPADQLGQGQTLKVASDAMSIPTQIKADGNHYAQGRNTFVVQFDPTSTVLTKATAFMPVHGHGTPAPPSITEDAGDYRISDFIFSMPGLWNITLDVTLNDKPDTVEFSLDVP